MIAAGAAWANPAALEPLYRAVFEHSLDGVLLTRTDGTILRANPAACRAFGLPEEEICGQGRGARIVSGEALSAFLAERERTGRATRILTLRRGDGSTFPAEVASAVIQADGGERATYVLFRDLTEQLGAERDLRRSEEELRLLAAAMPQLVCVLSPEGAPEYVNPAWTAFSGLDLPGTRRLGWRGALHPEDVAQARECLRRVTATREGQDVELRYRAADGSYRWFLSRLVPVLERGRVVRFVGAATDIELRKRAEEANAREREVLLEMFARLPVMVATFDPVRGVFRVNQEVERVLGWTNEDAARPDHLEQLYPDPGERARAQRHAQAPDAGWAEFSTATKDGAVVPTSWANVRLRDDLFVAVGLDLRDRKRAEEALRDVDRRKDEFLGMLSHELRNPLAPIRMALHLLERVDPAGEQAKRARVIATRQVTHLTRLVDDLLDVTRIARGKIELRRAELDLAGLARRTAEDHRDLVQDRGLTLEVDVPAAPMPVDGDETRLAQVLGNLIQNAAKFTPPGGGVELSAEVRDGRAVVHVRDTGPGIPPEMLASIFDPFTQAKQTLARTEGGLGLGLALVKGLVTLHGGEVTAAPGRGGAGADLAVSLPLARGGEAPGPAQRPAAAPARARRRVLVVDDNHDAADTIAQLVELFGHEAVVAHDGPGAVAKAREVAPDVVLCDLGLPGLDGHGVARALRAGAAPKARLIAVSGYAQPEDLARAAAAGFEAHVAKPPDPERLRALIER